VNTTVHYIWPGGLHIESLPFDATTPESLVWSVDADDGTGFRELYSVGGSSNVPNVSMYLVIHTAIGGIGGGNPEPASFPQTYEVDSVPDHTMTTGDTARPPTWR